MHYQNLDYETRERVALVTLKRPHKLNAWTQAMAEEILDAITRANADDGVGAIILTGEGRAFCAGADIKEALQAPLDDPDQVQRDREDSVALRWIEAVRAAKPLIAAVNGPAVGVGVTMILPFDCIIASRSASFGMFFVKMGLVPELASSHFLVQRVGFGRASEMCLTGRTLSATEAVDMGLADQLSEPDELMADAHALASEIAANPSPQLRMIKQLLTEHGSATDLAAVIAREGDLLAQARDTPEHREALQAFADKRPPRFHP